ncbi:hypothetical protein [Arcticibacter tournemirensis]|uniref:Lipocalin-like domain-containing protein n=1 Tax=Arcticibacter tournemirensis TaxID=699437 RepID=A0A4V1KHM0_9SPHI|nr:hypothetical protein [Arcticibacter tournemirensis]RXF67662.1 hypothetical protein EKH83_18955 [Arcticibacter tournemirensis]
MQKLAATFMCLLLITISFSACKKDRSEESENLLIGDWSEIGPDGQSLFLKFDKNYSFWFSSVVGETNMKYSGTYSIKGDALKVIAAEMSVQEPGKPVQTTAVRHDVFPEATYSVSNDTLTLTYQTYTAAWPVVPATVKFRRMIID